MTTRAEITPDPKPPGGYRILHSADWHLGKLLGEQSREAEHARFLDWLLKTILAHQVDALIVAGDIFDSPRPPQTAVRQYFEFLATLHRQTDCEVIITSGNHDSPAHLDAPREPLRALRVHVVGEMSEDVAKTAIPLPGNGPPQILVAAIPFLRERDLRTGSLGQSESEIRQALRDGIQRVYNSAAEICSTRLGPGTACIAVGHLTVTNTRSSDSEREIHIGGLGSVDSAIFPELFQYVALGHLHRPQVAGDGKRVVYSGSPIPLGFGEATDKKSVRIIDFQKGQLVQNQTLPIPVARHLVQIRTTRNELEQSLKTFEPECASLPTWVELTVVSDLTGENLNEIVRELTTGKTWQVIRTVIEESGEAPRLAGELLLESEIDRLLENPVAVFENLLQSRSQLSDDELVGLRTAFRELLDIVENESPSENAVEVLS